ncbi:tyrosine-type recombinase/integrase [Roseicitreum antarcticum]|uniref:Site-specific recombinase XerD n=1 Tax=Roseicitreum antarcticum TaxID=564137 RepID=A0A1H2W9E2_9RHOB|nr:tyrosine-type recombinase/integrase [Roseicitreum antarcticum]SDW77210.1 Site-specific recombinase XerD [Roseicitreum antarcticum]
MKRTLPTYCYAKGKRGYIYFIRRGCKPIRMHERPGTAEFAAEYALAMKGRSQTTPGRTFAGLIKHYKASHRFAKLAPRSKQDYDKVLEFITDRIGDINPVKVQRRHVIAWQSENAQTQRFANYLVQIIRILMERAIDLGWRTDNPAKGVSLLKPEKAAPKAWPHDLVKAYRAAASGPALLIFELCLGTGQRIGDVLRMRWDHLEAGGINVRQGKTGNALWVPLTAPLRAALDATPKGGLTILTNGQGKPLPYKTAQGVVMRVRKSIGADAYSIHGLRHTAASELATLGFSDEDITALTGHSSASMVAHYTESTRQRSRAERIGIARNGTGPEQKR